MGPFCFVVVVTKVNQIMDIPDLEIVGLSSDTNGRSYSVHEFCGEKVEFGNILGFVSVSSTLEPNQKKQSNTLKLLMVLIYAQLGLNHR